jgi:hypothetical protein
VEDRREGRYKRKAWLENEKREADIYGWADETRRNIEEDCVDGEFDADRHQESK